MPLILILIVVLLIHVQLLWDPKNLDFEKKTIENCDKLIKLNSNKNFKSFNVSVATGIILSELSRQRKY